MSQEPLVPADFAVPLELQAPRFRLEPLGPQHNAPDLTAWMSSIEHIRHTPGFEGRNWPPDGGLTAEANLRDLEQPAKEFEARVALADTVLSPGSAHRSRCRSPCAG